MWHAGGDYWTRWYPAIRDALLKRQAEDGSWLDASISNEYGTSMACIILQMPNNYSADFSAVMRSSTLYLAPLLTLIASGIVAAADSPPTGEPVPVSGAPFPATVAVAVGRRHGDMDTETGRRS